MPNHITVTGQIPDDHTAFCGVNTPVTEIRVVNMLDTIGKLVLYLGDTSIALTPQMWDVVLNCLVDAVGPTRRLTIAEKLDAAADDNGQEFGRVLSDFIGSLGAAK